MKKKVSIFMIIIIVLLNLSFSLAEGDTQTIGDLFGLTKNAILVTNGEIINNLDTSKELIIHFNDQTIVKIMHPSYALKSSTKPEWYKSIYEYKHVKNGTLILNRAGEIKNLSFLSDGGEYVFPKSPKISTESGIAIDYWDGKISFSPEKQEDKDEINFRIISNEPIEIKTKEPIEISRTLEISKIFKKRIVKDLIIGQNFSVGEVSVYGNPKKLSKLIIQEGVIFVLNSQDLILKKTLIKFSEPSLPILILYKGEAPINLENFSRIKIQEREIEIKPNSSMNITFLPGNSLFNMFMWVYPAGSTQLGGEIHLVRSVDKSDYLIFELISGNLVKIEDRSKMNLIPLVKFEKNILAKIINGRFVLEIKNKKLSIEKISQIYEKESVPMEIFAGVGGLKGLDNLVIGSGNQFEFRTAYFKISSNQNRGVSNKIDENLFQTKDQIQTKWKDIEFDAMLRSFDYMEGKVDFGKVDATTIQTIDFCLENNQFRPDRIIFTPQLQLTAAQTLLENGKIVTTMYIGKGILDHYSVLQSRIAEDPYRTTDPCKIFDHEASHLQLQSAHISDFMPQMEKINSLLSIRFPNKALNLLDEEIEYSKLWIYKKAQEFEKTYPEDFKRFTELEQKGYYEEIVNGEPVKYYSLSENSEFLKESGLGASLKNWLYLKEQRFKLTLALSEAKTKGNMDLFYNQYELSGLKDSDEIKKLRSQLLCEISGQVAEEIGQLNLPPEKKSALMILDNIVKDALPKLNEIPEFPKNQDPMEVLYKLMRKSAIDPKEYKKEYARLYKIFRELTGLPTSYAASESAQQEYSPMKNYAELMSTMIEQTDVDIKNILEDGTPAQKDVYKKTLQIAFDSDVISTTRYTDLFGITCSTPSCVEFRCIIYKVSCCKNYPQSPHC